MASTDQNEDPEATRSGAMDADGLAGRRLYERLRRYEDNPMATAISKHTGPISPALLTALYSRNDALVHRLTALSRRDAALATREQQAAQAALATPTTDDADINQVTNTTEEEEVVTALEAGMARREAAMAKLEAALIARRAKQVPMGDSH